jgi:hypothetical protein
MKTLTADIKDAKNTLHGSGPWVWIVDATRDSSNVSRYALGTPQDVTFDGQAYTAKAGTFEPPEADSAGTLHNFKVTLGNADQTEAAYLELDKYRDQQILVRLVNLDHLDSATNCVKFRGVILSADMDELWVVLNCGTYNLRHAKMPGRTCRRVRCWHDFKDDACQYAGGETSCDHRYSTCEDTMNNLANFGAFPGMPLFRA